MYSSKERSSIRTENDNFLSRLYNSKEEFEREYKKIRYKKTKVKDLYFNILSKLECSMICNNLEDFINLSTLIGYITNIENRKSLKVYYDNSSNPIRCTNFVILASKYKKVKLLEYLFDNQSTLLNNLSINIGKTPISPSDVDEARHNAFYYAIRSGDIVSLDALITKWPGKYFNAHLEELDEILSKAYEDLKLNNVLLTDEMEVYVEEKIIRLRIFSDNYTQVRRVKSYPDRIKERIELILENTALLRSNADEVSEKSLFLVTFIAQNIHILKRQLKSTYDRLPWEEMEFCLVSFVSSYRKQEEMNLFYRAVLNKTKILIHLENFVKQLEYEKTIIEHMDVDKLTELPKLKRDEVVKKIINSYPQFEELYNDYNQISDIYSLRKISSYIKLATSADPYERESHIIIMRVLQVVGEFLKNTLESPKLSKTTSELLLLSLSKDSRQVILDLRNSLSHSHALCKRIEIESQMNTNYLISIVNDIKKVESVIVNILFKNKIKIIRTLLQKIIYCENVDDIKSVCEILHNVNKNKEESESVTSVELEKLETLIKELNKNFVEKTNYEEKLLIEMNNIINLEKTKSENDITNYSVVFALVKNLCLRINSVPVSKNVIKISKFIANKVLLYITPKIDPQALKEISELLANLFQSVKFKKYANIDEIKRLGYEILWIIQFDAGSIKSLADLRDVLKMKSVKTKPKDFENIEKNKDKYFTVQLVSKLTELKSILEKNEMNESVKHIYKFKKDKSLQAVVEMLVLDIMSILGSSRNCLENNFLFSIDCSPLLTGKVLRNYLAHDNAFVNVLLSDPLLAIILNAKVLVAESDLITGKKRIGKQMKDDTLKLKYKLSNGLTYIQNKDHMFTVAEEGNIDGLKNCLKTGADINARNINSWTVLQFGAKGCNLEVFKFILDQNLNVYAKDNNNQSLLHIAAANGGESIVEFLLSEQNLYVDDVDSSGRTPVHMAAINGHVGILKILLKHKASTIIKDSNSFCPLHYAIENNYLDIAKMLVKKEQNVDDNTIFGGYTPLHIAAEWCYPDIVKFLLENKSNVNAKNDKHTTPLHLAALSGDSEVVKILISKGAELNARVNDGCSSIHYAVEHGHEEIVNILIKHGVDVNVADIINNITPLHCAAKYGFESILKTLLKNKANHTVVSSNGSSPLYFAVQNGHKEIVNVLLRHGASVNLKNKNYLTPLHIAALNNHTEIAELLIKYKGEVNGKDIKGRTPLHLAVTNGTKDIVDLLIKNKAYVNAKDVEGCASLHTAVMYGGREVVNLLIKNKADVNIRSNNGFTPLHIASGKKNKDIVIDLIRNKAEVHIIANNRLTPLHIASTNEKEIVEILIKNKAEVNFKDAEGGTPLHLAVFSKKKDIISTLIKSRAEINVKDDKGNTPLHVAVRTSCQQDQVPKPNDICNEDGNIQTQESSLGKCCSTVIIELLIENGANIHEENKNHDAPILLGVMNNCKRIVKLLTSKGANVNSNNRLLTTAIFLGYDGIVNILLSNKAAVNAKDSNGDTPLHCAAFKGEKKIANLLIAKGAKVNAKSNSYDTPLHYAAKKGYKDIVEILLENGADVNSKAIDGTTPLHVSADQGHNNIVKILLKNGVEIHRKDCMNRTSAELAASSGRLQVVKTLLEHTKVDINSKGSDGYTMLHIAVQAGSLDITKYLVSYGANINVRNSSGSKPAHIACRDGHKNIVKYFIDIGLKVNDLGHHNQSLLHYSVLEGHCHVVEFLIKRGADINAKDIHALTPLHIAAMFGHFDVVKLLLTHGAMYDSVDCYLRKPSQVTKNKTIIELLFSIHKLFKAIKSNDFSIIDKSIREVGFLNVKNANFQTPLFIATWKGHDEIVKKLLQNGADPNVVSDKKYTPLHFAAKLSYLKIVIALLSNGAIYNSASASGKTPVDFATNEDIRNVFELVEDSFCKIKNGNCNIINDLKMIKCTDTLHAIMNAKDKDNKTLIICAINNNFTKFEQLKRIGLPDDVFVNIEMADVLCKQEKFDNAITILSAVLKQRQFLQQDSLVVLDIVLKIAWILYEQQHYQEALQHFEEVVSTQRILFGKNSPVVLNTKANISLVLHRQGKNQEALTNFKNILKKQIAILGENHVDVLTTQAHMALVLDKLKKYEEALSTSYKVFEKFRVLLGEENPATLSVLSNIAMVLNNQGKSEEALVIYNNTYQIRKKILGPFHSDTLRNFHNLTAILTKTQNNEEALKMYQEVYETQKAILGPNHLDTLNSQNDIANLLFVQGKLFGAFENYKESFDKRKAILGPIHPDILHTVSMIQAINMSLKLSGEEDKIILLN